jgi:hypothetical protein
MRSSSDWVQAPKGTWTRAEVPRTRGLNPNHNHTLKAVFKGAATTVITQHPDDPLHAAYRRMLTDGTKPNLAKLTLARKLAALALAMWKHQEAYDPAKQRKPSSSLVSGLPRARSDGNRRCVRTDDPSRVGFGGEYPWSSWARVSARSVERDPQSP